MQNAECIMHNAKLFAVNILRFALIKTCNPSQRHPASESEAIKNNSAFCILHFALCIFRRKKCALYLPV